MDKRTGMSAALVSLLLGGHPGMGAGAPSEASVKLATITVLTDDFSTMLPFYRDVIGLELLRLSPDYAEFQNEGLRLHLTTRATMKEAVPHKIWDEKRGGQSFELAFFFTWLVGVSINLCQSYWRASRRDEELPELSDVRDGNERDVRLDAESILERLPPGYRTVLVLHAEGYTHDEIGDLLSISDGTSKSQLARARQAAQRLMKGEST